MVIRCSSYCGDGLYAAVRAERHRSLLGQVTDPDGGAIPGASIQVINQESLAQRTAKTDAIGAYVVPSLPAGRYQSSSEATGFDRKLSDVITVVAGQNFVFDVRCR